MKWFTRSVLLPALLFSWMGCAHSSPPGSSLASSTESSRHEQAFVASSSGTAPPGSAEESPKPESLKPDNVSDSPVVPPPREVSSDAEDRNLDYVGEENPPESAGIADPLEPFNRAMFHFNDKLYFWVLKPVAQGYGKVVPEVARVSVKNFFSNISAPVRIVNCVLQADLGGAAQELGRFMINTTWGIGGLLDVASVKNNDLPKKDKDFGQTLGIYGLGQGFYINWPILGPSSPRDTVGLVGDAFLHPFYYITTWDVSAGLKAYEKVNATSLSIGDYESLKDAAIDPYVAFRDAYVQYRRNKVKGRGGEPLRTGAGVAVSPD